MNPQAAKLQDKIPDNVLTELDGLLIARPLSDTQLASFLAQCSHESGGFKLVQEKLNYSADGLLKTFGKYFDSDTAKAYERQPEKIANRVYANRNGNGNEASGDGWKYRGRGYIQLTGKKNYGLFDEQVPEDIVSNPDLVATKYPLKSAWFFFDNNSLWPLAQNDFTTLTKRINGGFNGLQDRQQQFSKFLSYLK